MTLTYDGTFDIATGKTRKELSWRNREMTWSAFLGRISETHRTAETYAEYMAAKKARQDEIKDVGGFVGGYLNGGRRKTGSVTHRQLITLDVDFGNGGNWDLFTMIFDYAGAVYSTHKHAPDHPRLRIIIPLDRPVTTDEYVAIARWVAGSLGINDFDDTTFEPTRLMYWPSTSQDGEYLFDYQDGPWMPADEILTTYYRNWRDASEWPVSDRAGEIVTRNIAKQGDPLEKPGIVGAFCREYSIDDAIDTFLPDVYEPCDVENRYSFIGGSTAAGLVIYDGKFAYSHHGTDPTSGKLCNAFDLVRIHRFGLQDEDAKPGTPTNSMPSFRAMIDFATTLPAVRQRLGTERFEEMQIDFAGEDGEEPNTDWLREMDTDRKGRFKSTVENILLILRNDPALKNKIAFDLFEGREVFTSSPPWRDIRTTTKYFTDTDDSGIRHHLEKVYDITGVQKILDAIKLAMQTSAFHPVRDYLSSLSWDGTKRLEQLLIDYLGAEDCAYTRAVTRKALVAAVARVFNPGCKYDYVLVLIGSQGIGKSTLVRLLARKWYSDSFSGVNGKEAYEQLHGKWIIEIAELAGIKKAEIEAIKHFISKNSDTYRVAYGRRTDDFKRQCIFIGTTNTRDFLSDATGNRRFWPVDTLQAETTKSVFEDLTDEVIDQIWAEAVTLYKAGEPLYLDAMLEMIAFENQVEHRERDDRTGLIVKYLDTKLPRDWDQMGLLERRRFVYGEEPLMIGEQQRDHVCIAEIWCELFGKPLAEMTRYNTRDLHNVMKTLPDWKDAKSNTRRFKLYGIQKCYSRMNGSDFVNEAEGIVYKSENTDVNNEGSPF